MSETKQSPLPPRRSGFGGGIVHFSILLLGAAGGFALTYSLDPPKPKSDLRSYHFCLISSPTPITDFEAPIQAMQKGVRDRLTQPDHWTIYLNHQFTRSAKELPSIQMLYPHTATAMATHECEMKLIKMESPDDSKFNLTFSISKGTRFSFPTTLNPEETSSHSFTIYDNKARVIQLDSGGARGRQYLYAMIMAHDDPLPMVKNSKLRIPATVPQKASSLTKSSSTPAKE